MARSAFGSKTFAKTSSRVLSPKQFRYKGQSPAVTTRIGGTRITSSSSGGARFSSGGGGFRVGHGGKVSQSRTIK